MVNNKRMTDACVLCNKENCAKCSLNAEYFNMWAPNETAAALMSDLYIPSELIEEVTRQTMEARCATRKA